MMTDFSTRKIKSNRIAKLPAITFIFAVVIMLQACQQLSPIDSRSISSATNETIERPGFLLWTAIELEQRNAQLGRTIRPDGSSRETLADYLTPAGSHRFRYIRRDSAGLPEQHDNIEDYVYIQSGQGTILVGGQMLGRSGDLGTEIIGGSRYSVATGDVLRIPAGIPHAYLPEDGGHITYVLTRVPAFRGTVVENPDGQAPDLEPPGFGLWRAAELERRNTAIVERMRSDGSSRETLADYGAGGNSHRLRFIRRDRDGVPELHEEIIDVVFIQSGQGTVLVGGEMTGESNVPGAQIIGGSRFPIAAGDVLHIPAKMPHAYLTNQGDHITYVLLRVPDAITVVERFTRVSENDIEYSYELNDPNIYTETVLVEMPLRLQAEGFRMYEYACHEGNYSMSAILAGARREEMDAAK